MDIQILQSRVGNEFPPDAIHLYGKNRNVYEYNEDELQGVEYTIMAKTSTQLEQTMNQKSVKTDLLMILRF